MSDVTSIEPMAPITPIQLPTPIDWNTKRAAAEQHIEELDNLLNPGTSDYHLFHSALMEVSKEVIIKERRKIAIYWSKFLLGQPVQKLKNFFNEWLVYTPTCESPGKYIEIWDFLVNTDAGLLLSNATDFKLWFREFLDFHGNWINSTSSTGTLEAWMTYTGTKEHPFNIHDYEVPTGGFESFNQFFLRNLKPGQRPLCMSEPAADVVAAPCDGGIFYLNREAELDKDHILPGKSGDRFNLKEAIPGYGEHFVGGPLLDILLWFTDYHHFHAPVSGRVIHQALYRGSYNYDFDDYNPNDPTGQLPPPDSDKVGWYDKLGKHQRYVWVIETENLGLVAMIAIGFWGVGSITNTIEEGATIEKGQYMGHFGYGGSSIVLAFEKDLGLQFKVGDKPVEGPDNPVLMKVRQCLGKRTETLNW